MTERLRAPLYLVAFVFAVTPIVDIVSNVLPLQLGAAPWRFGATGVAANYLVSILFGSALAAALALDGGRRGTAMILSLLNVLAGLLLVIAALSLLLDAIQLHHDVPPDTERMFMTGVVKSQFKLIMSALTFGALGWALFRHARATRKGGEAEPAFLVRESKGTKKP